MRLARLGRDPSGDESSASAAAPHERRVVELVDAERFDDAIGEIERILLLRPRHTPTLLTLALLLEAMNDWKAAESTYEEILSINPDCQEATRRLSLARSRRR